MKIRKILALSVVLAAMVSCTNQPKQVSSLDNEIDSVSYAIGIAMSQQLKGSFEEVNKDVLVQAIRNGLDSTNLLIDIKYTSLKNVKKWYSIVCDSQADADKISDENNVWSWI